jgi:hypothetical protein
MGFGPRSTRQHSFDMLDHTDTPESAFELLVKAAPRRRAAAYLYRAAEALRPFIGLDQTRSLIERVEHLAPLDAADETSKLRLELQLAALGSGREGHQPLLTQVRAVAQRACAPFLAWIADWAEAVAMAQAGAPAEAAARARAATAALAAYGEPYTAARLLADLLPFLGEGSQRGLAEEIAERLERMGALASAEEAWRSSDQHGDRCTPGFEPSSDETAAKGLRPRGLG